MSRKRLALLLIEDNPGDARLIQECLNEYRGTAFLVEWRNRLATGLERLAHGGIDAVLLDLSLPDGHGIEVFDRVRAAAPTLPIILLTGTFEDEAFAIRVVQKGAQDYLIKGKVDPQRLVHAILYAMERKQLDRMKDDFIGIVSHELRTPLGIITGGLYNLQKGVAGPLTPKQTATVDLLARTFDRLTRLVHNLLDLTRLESGKTPFHRRQVAMADLLKETVRGLRAAAAERGLLLEEHIPATLPAVYADPDMVVQTVTNLIGNALRFAKRRIRIEAAPTPAKASIGADPDTSDAPLPREGAGGYVRVSVTDDGPGIAPADRERIFRKFEQVGTPPAGTEYKGTGLGLAICREIVAQHQGALWVESAPHAGATFHFTVPQYG